VVARPLLQRAWRAAREAFDVVGDDREHLG
jgi:hypothetical protein